MNLAQVPATTKKIVGSEDTSNNYVTKCTGQFVCCTC